MNSDIQPVKNHMSKRENLKKAQIYKRNNTDDLQVVFYIYNPAGYFLEIYTKNNVKVFT